MKLTVKDIHTLVEGLNELNEKELPISLAFKLQRNSLKVNEEIKLINEMRKNVLDKYKDGDVDDGKVKIKEGMYDIAQKELDELDGQELEVDLQKINISEFEQSGVVIKPLSLIQIEKIIKQDEGDESKESKDN